MAKRTGRLSLQTRVGLTFTVLVAVLLFSLGNLWVQHTRRVVALQVAAAGDVAEQWLSVVASELRAHASATQRAQEIARIYALGAVRDNALEVIDQASGRIYRAPELRGPAGPKVPRWFVALVAPRVDPWRIGGGGLTFVVTPDPAPALAQAWGLLRAMAGRTVVVLLASLLLTWLALRRSLRPLDVVMRALERTGEGRFDTRLPVLPIPELDRLARAFNGMVDRLREAVDENVKLHSERATAAHLQAALEAERRSLARELHDELAQCITAVRAIAGAIAQRAQGDAATLEQARRIVAVAGQMQDGVRVILQRLHRAPQQLVIDDLLRRDLETWQRDYPEVALRWSLAGGSEPLDWVVAHALQRVAQEGLTNVARHAEATRVDVALRRLPGDWLELVVADDGCGFGASSGGGLGLAGMRARVLALGGELSVGADAGRGTRLCARLQRTAPDHVQGCHDGHAAGRAPHSAGG